MAVPDLQDALALREQGRPAEAAEALERLVAALPAYATAYVVLAQTYAALDRRADALRAWQSARALLPGHDALAHAYVQARAGQPEAVEVPVLPPTEPEAPQDEPPADILPNDAVPDAGGRLTDAPRQREQPLFEGDLDGLIAELEAARIVPNRDLDSIPTPELDPDVDDVVSETLARIYVAQGAHTDAARAFARLAQLHPARADEFEARAAEQRALAEEQEVTSDE